MAADPNSWMPLFQTLAGGLSAIGAVAVTQVWTSKRDLAKKRIDLAEDVLALFYEVEEAIRQIRGIGGFVGEGRTRKRGEHETAEQSEILDNAFVVIERYNKREQTFSNLRSKKYRYMAMFRGKSHEPFDKIDEVINKIFIASHLLGTIYWPRQGRVQMNEREASEHFQGMNKQRATLWDLDEDNEIRDTVRAAILEIEAISDSAAKEYAGPFGVWSSVKRWIEAENLKINGPMP